MSHMAKGAQRLIVDLNDVPKDLRRSLRPMLPFTRREPRGWRDVARCLFGRHCIILCGRDAGMFIERCSCGAVRLNGGRWFGAHPFERRDSDGHTGRQRRELRRINEAVDRTVERYFPRGTGRMN